MLKVIDHTNHPSWTPINLRLGRENGARTYSRDIVKFYVPVFKRVFSGKERVLLITVQNWNSCEVWKGYSKIFVFVHERGSSEEVRKQKREALKKFAEVNSPAKVYFIVWCPQHEDELIRDGLNAIYLPMAIDMDVFVKYQKVPKNKNKTFIYYGNIIQQKVEPFKRFREIALLNGWKVDFISKDRLNGKGFKLSPEQIRRIIAQYKYGVAVGRSAQELSAMGVKVVCYALGDVMLARNDEEAEKLMAQNNTSWGEGMKLEDFMKIANETELDKIRPLCRDCRDIAKELESKLQQIKNSVL